MKSHQHYYTETHTCQASRGSSPAPYLPYLFHLEIWYTVFEVFPVYPGAPRLR